MRPLSTMTVGFVKPIPKTLPVFRNSSDSITSSMRACNPRATVVSCISPDKGMVIKVISPVASS